MSYKGSKLLMPLANAFDLPIDQLNFITIMGLSILSGFIYRTTLPPCVQNTKKRHIFNTLLGICFCYFTFGNEMIHLISESIVCYLALLLCPRKYVHLVVFFISMGYLSALNVCDVLYNYAIKTVNITVLMMITTQKFTSLAFSYYDGMKPVGELTQDQLDQRVEQLPSVLEYLSYIFNFQGIIVGPLCFYRDYIDFVTGMNVIKHKNKHLADRHDSNNNMSENGVHYIVTKSENNGYGEMSNGKHHNHYHSTNGNGNDNGRANDNGNGNSHGNGNSYGNGSTREHDDQTKPIELPSVKETLIQKTITFVILVVLFLKMTNAYPVEKNFTITNEPLWYRIFYVYMSVPGHRIKYYLAWVIADITNNVCGLGFNGYDEKTGKPVWDLVTNVRISEFELSTNIKSFVDSWNITTRVWLRRIAYDRLPAGKTLGVFVLSAFWHGFYPGYYLMFVLLAFLTYTGRGIRRKIRPIFIKHNLQTLYAVITWIFASFALNYTAFSFIVLEFWLSIEFYKSWYWIVHIVGISIPFILPGGSVKKAENVKTKSQ